MLLGVLAVVSRVRGSFSGPRKRQFARRIESSTQHLGNRRSGEVSCEVGHHNAVKVRFNLGKRPRPAFNKHGHHRRACGTNGTHQIQLVVGQTQIANVAHELGVRHFAQEQNSHIRSRHSHSRRHTADVLLREIHGFELFELDSTCTKLFAQSLHSRLSAGIVVLRIFPLPSA